MTLVQEYRFTRDEFFKQYAEREFITIEMHKGEHTPRASLQQYLRASKKHGELALIAQRLGDLASQLKYSMQLVRWRQTYSYMRGLELFYGSMSK